MGRYARLLLAVYLLDQGSEPELEREQVVRQQVLQGGR